MIRMAIFPGEAEIRLEAKLCGVKKGTAHASKQQAACVSGQF
jgi:hypothetical protein